ncbi:hypothetical protein ACFSKW_26910 [Nonomuraea mangrovi]|uniref:Uncharacterized protein n=1 Tax=Nonomuraea mangrovi TaxID=2316207 RepID=A0ABW4T1S9_9ACTN
MGILEAFHGTHTAAVRAGYRAIDWSLPALRCDRVRVRAHTCECGEVLFEFCLAGGLSFIRRTVRHGEGVVVHESDWFVTRVVERLWEQLLRGEAR